MIPDWEWPGAIVLPVLVVAASISVYLKKMDLSGGFAGVLIGMGLFWGGGMAMLGLLAAFFLAGSLATSWRYGKKAALGLAEGHGKPRSAANALANGGIAALLGIWAWLAPASGWPLPAMMAAALAAATSDTLSSELGNVYGRRFVNIITLSPDQRGADGVISLEGTIAGLAGSLLIALLYGWFWRAPVFMTAAVAIAGLTGNLADSLLGATLQRGGWLNNHQVNVANTATGAVMAALLSMLG